MGDLSQPRQLTNEERSLLDFLLSANFPGKDALTEQAKQIEVSGECDCGCGTVDFRLAASAAKSNAREPIFVEAYGEGVDVLLLVRDGYLQSMEIVHHAGAAPGGFPQPEKLRLWRPPDSGATSL